MLRQLALGLITVALLAALVAGTALSMQQAGGSNPAGGPRAGTVSFGEPAGCSNTFTNMAPGDSRTITCSIPYTGTLDAIITVDLATGGSLFSAPVPLIVSGIHTQINGTNTGNTYTANGAGQPVGQASQGQTIIVTASAQLPQGAGNAEQNASGTWGITFHAVQANNKHATALTYLGDTAGDYNDPVTLAAVLTDTSVSPAAPLAGSSVTLTLGSQTCTATTDSQGQAACSVTPNVAAGATVATATYAGSDLYQSSNVSAVFTVNLEETTLAITHTTLQPNGTVQVQALLREDGTTPIVGRTVTFTAGSSIATGSTDTGGVAAAMLPPSPDAYTVRAAFAGDGYYRSSHATSCLIDELALTLGFYSATSVTPVGHSLVNSNLFVNGDLSTAGQASVTGIGWATGSVTGSVGTPLAHQPVIPFPTVNWSQLASLAQQPPNVTINGDLHLVGAITYPQPTLVYVTGDLTMNGQDQATVTGNVLYVVAGTVRLTGNSTLQPAAGNSSIAIWSEHGLAISGNSHVTALVYSQGRLAVTGSSILNGLGISQALDVTGGSVLNARPGAYFCGIDDN